MKPINNKKFSNY